jgi:cholesterol oxidase
MTQSWDVAVIGSGFGGAVIACRLAETGARVLVLERGRRWASNTYPRAPEDPWIFDVNRPERQNGWLDVRFLRRMIVAQGAGVGGGSLVYANISVEASPEIFEQGWPAEITYGELKPHYDRVGEMLNVQEIPDNQPTLRLKLMQEGAQKLGYDARFRKLPLAVTFDPQWSYELKDPFEARHSKEWINPQGRKQGTCIHLGNCDIGCEVNAKNTLDLTYLAQAESRRAEIRPLHVVRSIEPEDGHYRIRFHRVKDGQLFPGSEIADRVVVAAGSLGSTELLLRCRDEHKTLPRLSRFLGRNWSSNGDFLTPCFYDDRTISAMQGPTISSAIDFLDGSVGDQRFFIEDGGFPNLLDSYLRAKLKSRPRRWRHRGLFKALRKVLKEGTLTANVMPWFAQGIDAADGQLYLGRKWYAPWKRTLKLAWDVRRSRPVIQAIIDMHERLSAATGGKAWVPPSWKLFGSLITPHPLGGCNMGATPANGVVDHRGKVFGYENFYVIDGAIIPEAIGRNPSRTIAALAERCAGLIR